MNKTKILIIGATGLLGNSVTEYFLNKKDQYDVTVTYRNETLLPVCGGYRVTKFDALVDDMSTLHVAEYDYVLNCIGVIKPFVPGNELNTIKLNSEFPWELSRACAGGDTKLIHITTDCAFSGEDGGYTEDDVHDCIDFYGKSKSLGEPTDCMVLRTSIIGDEIHQNASLVAWVRSQAGGTVNGYSNHLWNGVTTKQYANICDQIIQNNLYEVDLFHVHSDIVSKYELLCMINDRFDLNITIKQHMDTNSVCRELSTTKSLMDKLDIPPLSEQLSRM